MAIELLRRHSQKDTELYYWNDRRGKEVDFLVKNGLKIKQLIQVCYDIYHYDTKKREIDALLKASNELNCKNLLVITADYDEIEEFNNNKINFVSLPKWLLEYQK